jgi:hypothetical protein
MTALLLALAAATQSPALPAFMTGCWDLVDGEKWTQECWMEPKAGIMLGASRAGKGNYLDSWEQLRIEEGPVGKLTLYASPEGRDWVVFQARRVSPTVVEFVNAEHDFPQRIRYELRKGRLYAEISLLDGSKPTRWTYVREKR